MVCVVVEGEMTNNQRGVFIINSIISSTLGAVGNTAFALYRAALFTRMVLAWAFGLIVLAFIVGISIQAIWALVSG